MIECTHVLAIEIQGHGPRLYFLNGVIYNVLILIVNWQDSRLIITPMCYNFAFNLFINTHFL